MSVQLQLSELPTACSTVNCEAPARWVLLPGPTGHCEAHPPERSGSAWEQAFASGQARVIHVGRLDEDDHYDRWPAVRDRLSAHYAAHSMEAVA